jgi:hypothetical protein
LSIINRKGLGLVLELLEMRRDRNQRRKRGSVSTDNIRTIEMLVICHEHESTR